MKICLLNDSFAPVIDGVVNVVMNYAEHLTGDHGAEVIVGTPRYPEADYSGYPYKVVPYHSFDTTAFASGYRAGNPLSGEAVSALAAFSPDIIHTHCPASSAIMARILREETDAPIVFTYHTKFDVDIERVVKTKLAAKAGIHAMVSNIEACDDVWVVSRGAGENLKALGFQGEYRVMNNGVDFDKGRAAQQIVAEVTKEYDLPADVPVFLFVGRMMTYKGLPLILDALKKLSGAGQDFRMVFVGKGPDKELMEQMAEEIGLKAKCFFTGPIYDREALRAWNTRADLFLFPSTFDTNGLVVREAAACGLASVLIEGSCAAEGIINGRNGFTIQESPEAMAALLLEVCGDLGHLHEVGQNAMNEIVLSWRDSISEAYDRYQTLLDEKKRGLLPKKKKLPADYFMSLTAHTMEEREKHRQIRQDIFRDFRETAVGMMDNIQDAEEIVEGFFDRVTEDIRREFDSHKKR